MSRQKKRTVVEEEYMKNHRNDDLKQVAADLGRSYEFVRKYVASLPKEAPLTPKEKYTRPINIVTETAAGRKGVAVMTETASQQITRNLEARRGKKKLGPDNAVRKIRDEG
jgi:hypothetical protein